MMTSSIDLQGLTLKMIRDRCDDVGDCWIWRDAVGRTGYPIMKRSQRGGCMLVRRVVVALDGRPAAPRQPVMCTCGEKRCVNPAHLQPTTISAVAKAAAAKGSFSTTARAARIAQAKRASSQAKLTLEQVREIRASDESNLALAERFGVNRSRIGAIRRGVAWKDYSNPFTALMRRAA